MNITLKNLHEATDRFLITRLQRIHDNYLPEDWDFKLKKLCGQYGVDSSWIDEVLNERA